MEANQTDLKRQNTLDKLDYPFTLIKQGPDAAFIIKQDDYNSRLCIFSDKPLNILDEEAIMKSLLKEE